ncbi:MAG: DUF262 domain-containing protein [Pseudomonadales bacterium]|jgi:hypothetical protein|nr:DUF262 domain-containing protein [Pseudomonadales bacterium]
MKINLKRIPVREVTQGYKDSAEEGVVAFGGKLDVRPKYQREFVYKDQQRDEVIRTIRANFPLNVMYWVKNDDGNFEVLDGQQRTISFCQYVNGDYSIDNLAFHNLTSDQQEQILNYELMVYECSGGTESERLEWFKIINIAGEKLTDQELRNAIYTGAWLSDAKSKFSKSNCAAYLLAKDYVNGSPIRQDFLETAINWINDGEIEQYMSVHQHDQNANELWLYFQSVIEWVKAVFPNYRREMKGINWGKLYNAHKSDELDTSALENKIIELMQDDDVTKRAGIYEYVLSGNERALNIRAFDDKIKRATYEKQSGVCPICSSHFEIAEMEADHITPWSQGGKTVAENCQMLCKDCNRRKSGK